MQIDDLSEQVRDAVGLAAPGAAAWLRPRSRRPREARRRPARGHGHRRSCGLPQLAVPQPDNPNIHRVTSSTSLAQGPCSHEHRAGNRDTKGSSTFPVEILTIESSWFVCYGWYGTWTHQVATKARSRPAGRSQPACPLRWQRYSARAPRAAITTGLGGHPARPARRPCPPRIPHHRLGHRARPQPSPGRADPAHRNEIAALFATLLIRPGQDVWHRLRWSSWRRRRQYRAKTSHYQRQEANHEDHGFDVSLPRGR